MALAYDYIPRCQDAALGIRLMAGPRREERQITC